MKELFKQIPQVSKIILDERVRQYLSYFYMQEIKNEIELSLNDLRNEIKEGIVTEFEYDFVIGLISDRLNSKKKYSLRRVINATGTVLHTNLGRAILSESAINNVVEVSSGYNNLEYNIELGERGSRYDHLNDMLATLVGAESALVVNNNAAATMLAVAAFSKGKEVVVSRGELVEIGGSFRIPDIIEASGAILKEVGTTNRTHLRDYENGTNENTAMYLKVHPSNYRIEGFTKQVSNAELVSLSKGDILAVEDLGSGALIDFTKYNFIKENTVTESLKSGIDLVTFSGDKLLGGPQAGIIVGKKDLIDKIKSHPLTRAFRVGKMTIAALEATLREYLDKDVVDKIPTLRMIFKDKTKLYNDALMLSEEVNKINGYNSQVEEVFSTVGGGSLPTSKIESYGIKLTSENHSTIELEKFLRNMETPIISIINSDSVYLDVRTLLDGDILKIVDFIKVKSDE
ncbi:L-seryl-tRNA(Sec) selenium transferase [Mycoplasmatota bacterium WC44]